MSKGVAPPQTVSSVGRPTKLFVRSFLVVIAVVALAGFELWPLTAFRLFSAARGDARWSYEAVTVDADGAETPLRQESLAFGYRLAEWPMDALDTKTRSRATTLEVCEGLAAAGRSVDRAVANVRILKVRETLVRVSGAWEIRRAPQLLVDCAAEGWAP